MTVIDAGRILNPLAGRNQIEGAVVMGIGMALLEHTSYDPQNGAPINSNLADYVMAVNADVPPIEVHFLDFPDTEINELGARGIGEIGLAGIAAAITAAVHHATGVRVRELPDQDRGSARLTFVIGDGWGSALDDWIQAERELDQTGLWTQVGNEGEPRGGQVARCGSLQTRFWCASVSSGYSCTTFVGAGSIATCAALRPARRKPSFCWCCWPVASFARSSSPGNVLAYVEVERKRVRYATSFAGTPQQLSLSMGVRTAALILHLTVGEAARAGLSSRDSFPVTDNSPAWLARPEVTHLG